MQLTDVLKPEVVKMELKARTRDEAIRELVELLAETGALRKGDVEPMTAAILQRESLGSTAIGKGVAIPHAKAPSAHGFVASLGRSTKGIEFDSLDGQPVFFVVLFVVPKDQFQTHLRTLAAIAKFLNDKSVRDELSKAHDAAQILRVFESRSPRS